MQLTLFAIKTLRANDCKLTNKPEEKVEILNEQFYSVFVDEGDDQLPKFEDQSKGFSIDVDELDIDYKDVLKRLKEVMVNGQCESTL